MSRIYRGNDVANLKSFQFLAFGAEDVAHSANEYDAAGQTAEATPAEPAAAVLGGHSEEELQEAYQRGLQDAYEQAGKQLERAADALAKALDEVNRQRRLLSKNSSTDMLRLVMAVAEQVIRQQAAVDPTVVKNIIEHALQEAVRSDRYVIRVNPADLDVVNEQKPFFLASISGLKNIHVEADPAISAGGCQVESEFGEVDATLESQLETIQRALRDAMAGA